MSDATIVVSTSGRDARDPLTLACAVAMILALSPVAIYLPVRRATPVDCAITLREQ